MDLKNKRIILIAPKFFGYEINIQNELEAMGARVHFYDERNKPSSIEKILYRKAKFILNRKITTYYRLICRKEKNFHPDYIWFINPETINVKILEELKKSFPSAKTVVYMWDSCKNKKIKKILPLFDARYSFDKEDCIHYNCIFRPLFYVNEFKQSSIKKEYKYGVSFIGTIHSDRAKILYFIKTICDNHKIPYFFYFYVPGKLILFLRLVFDKYLRKIDKDFIHTEPLEKDKISEILDNTCYIIDINHPKQVGLTMRTIEMIGLKRKIITTNKDVKNYDFYNPINQVIIDRDNICLPIESFDNSYVDIDKEVYEKYSLKVWIEDILLSDSKLMED